MVDTNFLFSILGLHDNPGNEQAKKLMPACRRGEEPSKASIVCSAHDL